MPSIGPNTASLEGALFGYVIYTGFFDPSICKWVSSDNIYAACMIQEWNDAKINNPSWPLSGTCQGYSWRINSKCSDLLRAATLRVVLQ